MSRPTTLVPLIGLTAFIASCGGPAEPSAPRCVVNPERVAARLECVDDAYCPCGTRCTLGVCAAACANDNDCGGGVCDSFGQCRPPEGVDQPAPARERAPAAITLSSQRLQFAFPNETRGLRLAAVQGDLGPIRVTVPPGYELQCGRDVMSAAECLLDGLPMGDAVDLRITLVNEPTNEGANTLRIFHAEDRYSVGLVVEKAQTHSLSSGRYRGLVRATQHGLGSTSIDLSGSTELAIEAELFVEDGVIRLIDRQYALHPAGELIGSFSTTEIHWPDFRSLDASFVSGSNLDVVVSGQTSTVRVSGSQPTLAFDLVHSFHGIHNEDAIHITYSVVLERTADLPSTAVAPMLPQNATRPALNRSEESTAWFDAFRSVLNPANQPAAPTDARGALGSGEGPLDVCGNPAHLRLVRAANQLVYNESLNVTDDWQTALAAAQSPLVQTLGRALVREGRRIGSPSVVAEISDFSEGIVCQLQPQRPLNLGDLELGHIDICEQVARDFDCVVERAENAPDVIVTLDFNEQVDSLPATVQRICRPTATWASLGCAELALCYEADPQTGSDSNSTFSSALSANVDATGELSCLSGNRSAGLIDANNRGLFEVFAACVAELPAAATSSTTGLSNGAGLAAVLGTDTKCLDLARFFYALETAMQPAVTKEPANWHRLNWQSVALAHRLIAQWLSLHAMVARESAEIARTRTVLSLPEALEPQNTLDIALNGLGLLLHPRFSEALLASPAEIYVAPDYRALRFAENDYIDSDAGAALPVTIIDALHAQSVLLERLLRREARRGIDEGSGSVVETHGRFLRMEAPLRALAAELSRRALMWTQARDVPKPIWIERYETSLIAYQHQFSIQLEEARRRLDGDNPLGISESDLPLYLMGDENTATSQFTAVSDFLIGEPGSLASWAPSAIREAGRALEDAREASVQLQTRTFQRRLTEAERDTRLDAIRRSYGSEVINLCGLPPNMEALDVLEQWPNFNANDCFILKNEAGCQVDTGQYEELMTIDDVRYHLCVVNELRVRTAGATKLALSGWSELAESLESCPGMRYAECRPDVDGPCVTCRNLEGIRKYLRETHTPRELLDCLQEQAPGCEAVEIPPALFHGLRGADTLPPAVKQDAENACQAKYPGAQRRLPGPSDLRKPLDRSCFNGSIGAMALSLASVATDLEIARSELGELQDAYDIAMNSCIIQQAGNDVLEATQAAHNETMASLRSQKASADKAASVASAVKDCASTAAGVTNPFAGGAAAVSCGAGAVEAVSEVDSIELQKQMDNAQAAHDAVMSSLENQIDEEICFNDAELHLVGVRTASLRITRAIQDLNQALYEMEQAKSAAQLAYDAGRAVLAVTRSRSILPPAHDFWLNEAVDTFDARMAVARRLTFLAVRAVEYEFQQTLVTRQDAVGADRPAELEEVMTELRSIAATRSIRGNRPTDLKVVLSLRKNLLQLSDQSTQPAGFHQLSEVQRFRRLLAAPKYAAYDSEGDYIGQRIPFNLAPLGALALGETAGIPVLAANDCAERLWSVNASIMGDELYRGDETTFTRIELLKSNTFYSQWCGDNNDTAFQTASVRPAKNLFREPRHAPTVGEGSGQSGGDSLFTRARLEPYFNVSRAELESDDYANGATTELAARGLYGAYALLIPAEVLSDGDKDGLLLNGIDDILLRLDYVSVAQ